MSEIAEQSELPLSPAPQAPASDPSDPNVVAEAIRVQLAEAERSHRETLRQAREQAAVAERERDTALNARASLEFSTVANALEAAEREASLIQEQIATAIEKGDGREAARLQVQAGRLGARIEQLEAGKHQMEADRNQRLQPQQDRPAPVQPQSEQEQREAYLAQQHPNDAAWMRAHPQFFTDTNYRNRVSAAHFEALAEGKPQHSPDYYHYVESKIAMAKPASAESPQPQQSVPAEPDGRSNGGSPPPAAPVRSAGTYSDNPRPRGDVGSIPAAFIETCINLYDLTEKDSQNRTVRKGGKPVPDMLAVRAAWNETLELDRSHGWRADGGGNPWKGAR